MTRVILHHGRRVGLVQTKAARSAKAAPIPIKLGNGAGPLLSAHQDMATARCSPLTIGQLSVPFGTQRAGL